MARSGRRLVIGAPGPLRAEDELLGGGSAGHRAVGGEVRAFTPPSEAEVERSEAAIAQRTAAAEAAKVKPAPEPPVVLVVTQPESGGDSPAASAAEAATDTGTDTSGGQAGDADTGGGTGEGADDGSGVGGDGVGDFDRGGLVGGEGRETIRALEGEYVLPRGAVKKLGPKVLEALRSGRVTIQAKR